MKNIAVTGISGYIGSHLLAHLDHRDDVESIIGIDTREPRVKSARLKFFARDIREPLGDLFAQNGVDTVVHLAFILRPNRRTDLTRQVDVAGTANLLDACRRANVKHLVYLSSHTVYGSFKDNPARLTEEAPLRPVPGFQYAVDKIENEYRLCDFAAANPGITLTVLRACPVLGPDAAGTAPTIMFQPFVMVGAIGCRPQLQFLHQADLVEIIGRFIREGQGGIYNVAGDGEVPYREVARLMQKRLLVLPSVILKAVIALSWNLHLQSASPCGCLEFLKYPPVVSTEKLKRELGFKFRYTSRETLAALAAAMYPR